MQVSSNHHLIPRVYLSSWIRSGNTIYSIDKENSKEVPHNIENICKINDYHSIKAGMPCCNEEELKEIFKILSDYEVICNNIKIKKYEEYNKYYYDFEKWSIYKKDGNLAPKKMIKREIDKVKIVTIEDLWNKKYENKWKQSLEMMEQRILNSNGYEIDEFLKAFWVKFIISMDSRGFIGNKDIKGALNTFNNYISLDEIDIPFEERIKPFMDNASKEIENNILLAEFRDFLNDKGRLYARAKEYINGINLQFIVANGKEKFLTSDDPSFFYKEENFYTHIMPITPYILIRFCKLDDKYRNKYPISRVNDKIVKTYNKVIIDNSYKYYFKY
ncbi:DUF4238 domain-containing protein [Clostridium sp.]|uniref:DUF4238 domain-containing protein n=1 Tax=Clostridium sp. TaxID=1506 RepID=UPI002615EB59|nr:DUF4238 domain-containing protein [Clostridium sp.]